MRKVEVNVNKKDVYDLNQKMSVKISEIETRNNVIVTEHFKD